MLYENAEDHDSKPIVTAQRPSSKRFDTERNRSNSKHQLPQQRLSSPGVTSVRHKRRRHLELSDSGRLDNYQLNPLSLRTFRLILPLAFGALKVERLVEDIVWLRSACGVPFYIRELVSYLIEENVGEFFHVCS